MQQQHKRNDTVRAEEEGQRKFNSTGDHDLDAIIQDSITYLKQRYPRHTSQHLNSFHSRTSDMLRNNNNVDKEYDQNTFVNKKNDAALALTPLPEVTVEPDMDNDSWVDLE